MTSNTVAVQMTLTEALAMLELDLALQSKLAEHIWEPVLNGEMGLPITGWQLQDSLIDIAEDGEFDGFTCELVANAYSNLAQVWRPDVYIFTKA